MLIGLHISGAFQGGELLCLRANRTSFGIGVPHALRFMNRPQALHQPTDLLGLTIVTVPATA